MLVGDDDIREKHLLSFYQTGNNSAKGTLSTCRGGPFSCTPGASLGNSSRHRGRVISEQGGALSGVG